MAFLTVFASTPNFLAMAAFLIPSLLSFATSSAIL